MFQRNNKDGAICGILVTYVDDFVYCGTVNWHENKVVKLLYIVKISKREKRLFRYIGLNFVQMGKDVFVDQNSNKSSLKPVELSTEKALQKAEGLTIEENSKLRSISGQLIRPDASFDSCGVNNYGKNSKLKNLLETNKAGSKPQSSSLRLVYLDLGNPEYLKVILYAYLLGGASQGTPTVFMFGNNRNVAITWKSKKLERVTESSMAPETTTLTESADAARFVTLMTREIFEL